MSKSSFIVDIIFAIVVFSSTVYAADTITVALTAKAFQYTILPVTQERGYMKEEGLDMKLTYMQSGPSLQAVMAGSAQFSGAGSSALVGISKGNAPMKTVLALNDQVLQWVVARPNVAGPADLKGKKVASAGIASLGTFMLKQILATKYGVDGKEVIFIDPGPLNRLPSLMSGAADAAIVSAEERYQAVEQGMKDFMYLGKELKNSWGTIATSDRFIKEQPKQMLGFARAIIKALRYFRADREGAIAAAVKFTESDRTLVSRMYDDMVKSFTTAGHVDEETQKNDLAIVKLVAEVNEVVPNNKAYDFSFARQAEAQLNKQGWKP
ncbi:MAG: ABC transporter substrate-binding protein [Deltaproteobacteria bacterium]|nr:ABC transporter substrate-binding protein [Deltaproteobacteria bacterium]